MRRSSLAIPVLVLVLAAAAPAQTVTVGNLPPSVNLGFTPPPVAVTAIDLSNPSPAVATLTAAAFTWQASPCPATVKIKFFRPSPTGALVFLTERGPYDVVSFNQFVFLSPPVSVQPGDLIGIARVASCGTPVALTPGNTAGFIAFGADVTFSVTTSQGTLFPNATLSVQATGTVDTPPPAADPAAIVPVVGSTPGAFLQAFFRTTVQIHNPRTTTVSGRLVYHPQGTPGAPTDPSLLYHLAPGETRTIPDLLPTMALSGLGSLDVVPDAGSSLPLVNVRVFNDAGTLGTSGFTEELVLPADALQAGERGVLFAPPDTALYRFNVGVRTLGGGATLQITVRDFLGNVTRTLTRSYSAHYFEQVGSTAFLEGALLGPSDTITIHVTTGSAIVYGATVDNRTNDPSMQIARRLP